MKKIYFGLVFLAIIFLPVFVLAAPYAYIPNAVSNTVSVIDVATSQVIQTVIAGTGPNGTAISPDGSKVYISNDSGDSVSVFDVATNVKITDISVGDSPDFMACNNAGTRLYVSNSGTNNDVYAINMADNTVVNSFSIGGGEPVGIAISSDDSKAYIADTNNNRVAIINLVNDVNTVTNYIAVQEEPAGVIINPAGNKVYVANTFDGDYGSVSVIDVATDTILATISVGRNPISMTTSKDGTRLFVVNALSGSISVIDTNTNQVTNTFLTSGTPLGIDQNSSGTKLLVVDIYSDAILEIDSSTGAYLNSIPVGNFPATPGNFVTPTSLIDVDSSSLAFSNTRIGKESAIHNLTVTNYGRIPLNISSASLSGSNSSNFIINSNNCTNLTYFSSCTIGISFKPKKTKGAKTASLTIVSDSFDNPSTTVSLSGNAVYAKKFVTKNEKTKEVLIKKKKTTYYTNDLNFSLNSYPKKLKKKKYYLNFEKKTAYPLNYISAKTKALKKYFILTSNFKKYSGKMYSVKMTFKYTQKQFKNLKKRNAFAKEKDLYLQFRTKDNLEWRDLSDNWKDIAITHNTKKNTFKVKYFSKFEKNKYYFGIGLK